MHWYWSKREHRNKYFYLLLQLNLYFMPASLLLYSNSKSFLWRFHIFPILVSTVQQCLYMYFFLVERMSWLDAFVQQINLETVRGSAAQLGAFEYHYVCQVPLILGSSRKVHFCFWQVGSRAAEFSAEINSNTYQLALYTTWYSISSFKSRDQSTWDTIVSCLMTHFV